MGINWIKVGLATGKDVHSVVLVLCGRHIWMTGMTLYDSVGVLHCII